VAIPTLNGINCNIDGTIKGYLNLAACRGIFMDKNANFLGGFAINLHITATF